ncbi:MAG: proline--tRNA ligase [Candidatus Margulisiibacteriota bacterium]|jgi:prolyl-tRNA synthetase
MKFSELFFSTLRETPSDAEVISHQLMLRAGLMRKLAQGIYSFLPLGYRVIQKIENIVREEMNKAKAQEVFLPSIIPAELWQESGRWQKYGKELLRLKDRHDKDFCYGPTHEEVITDLVRNVVKSYKQLPLNLYQIQTKFRDEIRPRFGLMRGREFSMKDAYSFHADFDDLDATYQIMQQTYKTIFQRVGLETKPIEADSGAIGGSVSAEFMVVSDTGEDTIVECNHCGYTANLEAAETKETLNPVLDNTAAYELVATPNVATIEELSTFFNLTKQRFIKAMVYVADNTPVLLLLRGDHTINEVKLQKILGCEELTLADEKTIENLTGAPVGFTGPINLKQEVKIIADHGIKGLNQVIIGANQKDAHFKNISVERDLKIVEFSDLRFAEEQDMCARCNKGKYKIAKGIELGHVFKLGTKYSEAMSATYLDQLGKEQPYIMGCYGIGIGRTMAAVIEQNRDQHGIIWPMSIAPYQIDLILVNSKDEDLKAIANQLYQKLIENNLEVIFDDRDESCGIKFKDADLIGFPIQIILGNKFKNENLIEIKLRKDKAQQFSVNQENLVPYLQGIIANEF